MDRLEERLAEVEIKLKLERRVDKLERSVRSCKKWLIVLGILVILAIILLNIMDDGIGRLNGVISTELWG